ncbi:hypothetical protein CPAR01_06990 [Colletotrichum paranaense]|uniref:GPI anchored protein n=1 Tax=Colletotrichum paranaense TaxID=1914294 RepID=A0ABQ9SNC0_9PEZI|nr:uncharacterized protein CPAR01_06990 [Colletotrichum paranaense]KAK1541001.1 hypothetical protein CPAR01_06990 [Colletotrichum paranaense]
MKASQILSMLGFAAFAFAQSESLAPSPTESVGCEPHGDHWHCEGARATTAAAVSGTTLLTSVAAATTTATEDHDHDHDDDHSSGTGSLAPSPTESVGCEPHGDHWHCDAAATAVSGTASASGTGSAAVTTTAAATTAAAGTTAAGSASPSSTAVPAGAARAGFGAAAIAVAVMAL